MKKLTIHNRTLMKKYIKAGCFAIRIESPNITRVLVYKLHLIKTCHWKFWEKPCNVFL